MLFRASAATLRAEALAGTLTARLAGQFPYVVGQRASDAEIRSWNASLPALASDLIDAGLAEVEVLIEYKLPLTSMRVDAVLAGVHPQSGKPSYVFIELKQWSEAAALEDAPELCQIPSYGRAHVANPIDQVRGYCIFATSFLSCLADDPDAVSGAAYLHNATAMAVGSLRSLKEDVTGQLFTGDRRSDFQRYLTSRLAPTSGAEAADRLLGSKVAPSRQLMKVAAREVTEREQFTLIGQQRLAYSEVLWSVEQARSADSKRVVLITGGPGSGKSVIALQLLGDLWRRGDRAVHATGSKSFTQTMRKVAGRGNRPVQNLFMYFNSFMTAQRNELDVVVCDEAHRLRETSANRWTKADQRTGKAQVDELIDCARVPVFLLDEYQVVRPGEQGSAAIIRQAAAARGFDVVHVDLDAQFRCGGSRIYEEWVLGLLGLDGRIPQPWPGDDSFSVDVASSPADLQEQLRNRLSDGFGARITAGYCWPWHDPRDDGTLVEDVQIGSWSMPWNLKGDRSVGGAPPSFLWATDDAGFGQVGCVYTAQGFEYDWNGVILGPDLVRRDGAWFVQPQASKDPAFRGLSAERLDPLLRNIYKVLLTRGMVGTLVYSTDSETQAFLTSLLGAARHISLPDLTAQSHSECASVDASIILFLDRKPSNTKKAPRRCAVLVVIFNYVEYCVARKLLVCSLVAIPFIDEALNESYAIVAALHQCRSV